jgi:hypothetical protein
MIGPEFLGVVLRNEENTIPCRTSVHLIQMRIQILTPKFCLLVLVVEDSNALGGETFGDSLDDPPILSSKGKADIIPDIRV